MSSVRLRANFHQLSEFQRLRIIGRRENRIYFRESKFGYNKGRRGTGAVQRITNRRQWHYRARTLSIICLS